MAEIRELLLRTDYRTFSKAEIRALQAEVRELRRRDRAWAMTSGGRTVAEMIEERGGELMPGETTLLTGGKR